jgi:hypothetical protein
VRLILAVIMLLSVPAAARADETQAVRQWMHARLSAELAASNPQLHLVSSFAMPLVTDVLTSRNAQSRRLLALLSDHLQQWRWRRWQCAERIDLHLINAFMGSAGAAVELPADASQLRACLVSARLLDVANALLFSCRFVRHPDRQLIDNGLRQLLAAQLEDGSFRRRDGSSSYYLTSHALLALHYCGAAAEAVTRSRDNLERQLPAFRREGFADGVAESLIFLRWTGAPARDEAGYVQWLKSLIAPDGGLCKYHYPGCRPRWHTVSLMMQLLLETQPPHAQPPTTTASRTPLPGERRQASE